MTFKLHQIYFQPSQLPNLDKDMIPYDNAGSTMPDTYEFYVFRKEYLEKKIDPAAYTGYVSWKFREKTGITAKHFLNFCEKNPGYDVYFINPFPIEISFGNVWEQGDLYHPGMSDLAEHLLSEVGYNIFLKDLPTSLRTTSYCNYWVGNKKFWDSYMSFSLPIWNYIFEKLSEEERKNLLARKDIRTGSSYFAFVFERLLTTFILTRPEIRALGYTYSTDELASKYPSKEANLVKQVQETESRFPTEQNPLLKNPRLLADLKEHAKSQSEWRRRPVHLAALRWLWLRMPLRLTLQKTQSVGRIYNFFREIKSNKN